MTGGLVPRLLLAALAGWVDVTGITRTGGAFLSFMSGNTTDIGRLLALSDLPRAGFIAAVIGLFVAGVAAGEVVERRLRRAGQPTVLALETAALAAGAALASPYPMVFAMGLQNATMYRAGGVSIGTTYVTGTLVQIGQNLARREPVRALRLAAVWLSLASGAVCGAFTITRSPQAAFTAPACFCACLAVASAIERFARRPLRP